MPGFYRCASVAGMLLMGCVFGRAPQGTVRPLGEETVGRLKVDVGELADDRYVGRQTGSEGERRAGDYIAAAFTEAGLSPVEGDTDLFHDFEVYEWSAFEREDCELVVSRKDTGAVWPVDLGVGWRPFVFSGEGHVETELVFAGYGITADEYGWDDYSGLDVEGKMVLLLRYEPDHERPTDRFDGKKSTRHSLFNTKVENAKAHGARGMIVVTALSAPPVAEDMRLSPPLVLEDSAAVDATAPEEEEVAEAGEESEETAVDETPFLAAQISFGSANEWVDLEEVRAELDGGKRPSEFVSLGLSVATRIARQESPKAIESRNVVGVLPGVDPVLKDEWVVVGAHYDHVGAYEGAGDTIFNGADDNASGTAGMMELARVFASGERPRRTVVFIAFSGEEHGLLGARTWTRDHPVDRVVFMLNLDMIGRNTQDPVLAIGADSGTQLKEWVEALNQTVGLSLSITNSGSGGGSDHDVFRAADVPVLFLHTGDHKDYHGVGDHPEKIDYRRMSRILALGGALVRGIAQGDRPHFVHRIQWLGAAFVEREEKDGLAVRVVQVSPDSRAGEAGLQVGDHVRQIGAIDLGAEHPIGTVMREWTRGGEKPLILKRDNQEVVLTVKRPGKRSYLGVYTAAVGGEMRETHSIPADRGVVVERLVPDGPSEQAGLQAGDVLLEINERPVLPDTLNKVLSSIDAGEVIVCGVLRQGEAQTLRVTLGVHPRDRD